MRKTMMAFTKMLCAVVVVVSASAFGAAADHCAKSPDGRNAILLYVDPLAYEVTRDGVVVVEKSEIGMKVDGKFLKQSQPVSVCSSARGGIVDAPVYKKDKVDLAANETFVDFGEWGVRLVARNDGVAYRFETKFTGRIRVDSEKASLGVPSGEARCWGMQTRAFGCEESIPFSKRACDIDLTKEMLYLPFAYEARGKYVLMAESDVRDYPIWNFGSRGGATGATFEAKFAGAAAKTSKSGAGIRVLEHADFLVETDGTRTFPWRAFVLTDAPAKFCEADILWALAPAKDKDADFSWVKPGKVAWDWWNRFDNGRKCDTKGYERFIDFAATNGLEYVVLDYYGYEIRFGFDIWKPCPAIDVDHLVKYAKVRGVELWHWMAFHQVYGDEERVASHFAKAGIKGFKVDFLDRGDADIARFMEKFAAECAKNRMHVEYHGAYRPTGLQRRYPNILNYEGIHGQEWMLPGLYRGDEKGTMLNDVAACYLRMSAGPMDYTPGAMLNHGLGSGYRASKTAPGTLGTRCRQLAQVVLYEAPLQMLCDSPSNYERSMECFSFMAKVPTVWKSAVGLDGTPDTMFVAARETRDGVWYAGGITTADARDCTLDTSFLGDGEWTAEMFGDAGDAKEDAQKYRHEKRKIKAGAKLPFHMAPGGGFIVRLTKLPLIHSHNDYAQKRPFWGAYEAGADSIEADIYLVDGDLFVAHDRNKVKASATLRSLYLEPIHSLFQKNGGKVRADGKPLQLLVDLKNGKPALDRLVELIEKEGFRPCFDIAKNPSAARLVITGDHAAVDDFLAYPDFVFFDINPRKERTADQYRRIPLISENARVYTNWRKGPMEEKDKATIRAAVKAAHAKGCLFRLWGFPDHKEAWELALELGLDYLNTDHPADAAAFLHSNDGDGSH